MKNKKQVLRTCIVTKEQLEKKELFRIVRDKEGKVFIDDSLRANGRGCYLKKEKAVIEKAMKSNALDRHLNTKVDSSIYEELINKL